MRYDIDMKMYFKRMVFSSYIVDYSDSVSLAQLMKIIHIIY